MPPTLSGPRCNRRVTCDLSPSNARSESALAVNPLDPYNLVGASKRFTNPSIYGFSLAAYASFDGGQSWTESAPLTLPPGCAGTSDPALAWDDLGNVYLIALPFGPGTPTNYTGPVIGIAVYKSTDGGRSWGLPQLIHSSNSDDKQWAVGDTNSSSPFHGNIYAAWDDGWRLAFARSTDHGTTWKGIRIGGVDQPAGTSIPGINDSFSPDLSVAHNGILYITWIAGNQIKLIFSTDGGNSFSAPVVIASGITTLSMSLPITNGWPHFPGATFRVLTLVASCTGTGSTMIVTWADYREGVSRIYYKRSIDGGTTWLGPASGQPLLTGAVASAANLHDFHPQVASTPDGELGCAFYEFGPMGTGVSTANLIHIYLAVSTNHGLSFDNRVVVTDQPWDPAVDAPFVHGDPKVTFIGEYFGLDASRLGFFPFWTDTRTGVQELYTSRLPINPTDLFIRDSSADIGNVPSPGNHWEYVDLIVRRQPDGDRRFLNEDLLRDGVTNHYIYARVTNRGNNVGRNVRLAVTLGNYLALMGLPGTEFRYPKDWYPGNWNTLPLRFNHLYLGESAPVNVPIGAGGAKFIIGPVVWPAAQIPAPNASPPWHPCLLAEVRADNDDSAGGMVGCAIDADPDPCTFSSYFWGNNNITQRNLTYARVPPRPSLIQFFFLAGNPWSPARFIEIIVDKGPELAWTPMNLSMERVYLPDQHPIPGKPPSQHSEIIFVTGGQVTIRANDYEMGELIAAPGTVWRPHGLVAVEPFEICFGCQKEGNGWKLTEPKAAIGFTVEPGELRQMRLTFTTPNTLEPGIPAYVRMFQRNDQRLIVGGVVLQIEVPQGEKTSLAPRPARQKKTRRV